MKKNSLILFGILLLGFALRFTACRFGLPQLYHADEPIVVNHALAYGTGDFNPHFFKIPPLVSYLLFGVYGIFFVFGRLTGKFANAEAFEFFFYSQPSPFYFLARFIFGVLAGTLAVWVLYRLIRRHFSVKTALLSAAFLAVNFLHVRDSHYVYADIPLILVLLSAFVAFFRALENPRLSAHVWSGAMIGLAAAVKYNGAALAIPYFWVLVRSPQPSFGKFLSRGFSASCAAAAVFAILNPFSWLDFSSFQSEIHSQALANAGVPWLHHLRYSLVEGGGVPLLFFALLGIFRLLFAFDSKKAAFALWIFAYYGILIKAGQPYDRYVLPLMPFLIFFAADFISDLADAHLRKFAAFLCFSLIFIPNLLKALLFDRLMLAPDTRTLARKWVLTHIPADSSIALDWDFYMPRLAFSKSQLQEKKEEISKTLGVFSKAQTRKLDYLLQFQTEPGYRLFFLSQTKGQGRFLFATPVIPYGLRELRAAGVRYVITTRLPHQPGPPWFYEQLKRGAKKVIEFNPYRRLTLKGAYDEQPLTGGPFLWKELWERERNGQPVEIYEILS